MDAADPDNSLAGQSRIRQRAEAVSLLSADALADKESSPSEQTPHKPSFSLSSPNSFVDRWRSTPLLHRLKTTAYFFVPSFLQRTTPSDAPRKPLSDTAYLDGVRGVAALLVVFCHLAYLSHDVQHGWGANGMYRDVMRLPILRLLYDGDPMVALFFVVSGYVLSIKPIRLRAAGEGAQLLKTVSSSIFRRGIRLYLPCAVSTLLIVLLMRMHAYDLPAEIMRHPGLLHRPEQHGPRLASTFAQLVHWAKSFFIFVHSFDALSGFVGIDYDEHLWTIPVEFGASLVLFLTQIGIIGMPVRFRLPTIFGLVVLTVLKDQWALFLFFSGMLIAEIHVLRKTAAGTLPQTNHPDQIALTSTTEPSSPSPGPPRQPRGNAMLRHALSIAHFTIGLYLASEPAFEADKTPGWRTLMRLVPPVFSQKRRFWTGIGGTQVVLATALSPPLQRLFTNAFSQYLGRISFAIYLVHGPIEHALGLRVWAALWRAWGHADYWTYEAAWFVGCLVQLPVIFWAADVFWRGVDMPSIRFARWLEGKCVRW